MRMTGITPIGFALPAAAGEDWLKFEGWKDDDVEGRLPRLRRLRLVLVDLAVALWNLLAGVVRLDVVWRDALHFFFDGHEHFSGRRNRSDRFSSNGSPDVEPEARRLLAFGDPGFERPGFPVEGFRVGDPRESFAFGDVDSRWSKLRVSAWVVEFLLVFLEASFQCFCLVVREGGDEVLDRRFSDEAELVEFFDSEGSRVFCRGSEAFQVLVESVEGGMAWFRAATAVLTA